MFKESVIENKKKKILEKKLRLNALSLRNKFLGEWASNILGLNEEEKLEYIKKVTSFKKNEYKFVIKKIENDFASNNIDISYKEIELKIQDFQIRANVIIENKFKINNWK